MNSLSKHENDWKCCIEEARDRMKILALSKKQTNLKRTEQEITLNVPS